MLGGQMAKNSKKSSPVEQARSIDPLTRLFLYVHAGGRCEFDGCNEYLLEHYPTETVGNFAEQAHIYAFKLDGPRGREEGRPDRINRLSNLILLCPQCHHLIDTNPDTYPVAVLKRFKADHEDRVHDLTGLSKDRDTVPLVLKGLIAGRPVDISDEAMQSAVAPNYLKRRDKVEIDLTQIPDTHDAAYWATTTKIIDQRIERLYSVPVRQGRTLQASVFALAPIPLLIHLGSKLSDKIRVDLFQRHRNPETWDWQTEPGTAAYTTRTLRAGSDPQSVALLMNLSGGNSIDNLPPSIDARFTLYELTLRDATPNPQFLRCRSDLDRLHDEYIQCVSSIRNAHPNLPVVHLFPAVPAPVAIVIGRSRLPKVDPALLVYDHDKRAGGFVPTLEVKAA